MKNTGTGIQSSVPEPNATEPNATATNVTSANVTSANVTVPNVTVIEFSDPTEVGESFDLIHQDVVQLESNPLRVRRVVVRLGTFVVLYHSSNLAVRTRTRLPDEYVAYTAFGKSSYGTVNGMPVGHDRILACMPGVEIEVVVAAGYESVAILLPPGDIPNHLRRRQLEDVLMHQKSIELLQSNPESAGGLYRWGRRLADIAIRQPELFDVPQTRAAAQVELLENILAVLQSVVEVESMPHDVTLQGHSRIVQLVEDFVLAHAAERLYVSDLCEAAGVSERTLQYAFKEMMGMTPLTFLTRLRLHRVRQSLRTACPGETTVTAEAIRWGFWNFGDFARAYRECFGELPSATLSQKS
jgi:AraC-like DNA-binding protein